jgi:hypothetical protein
LLTKLKVIGLHRVKSLMKRSSDIVLQAVFVFFQGNCCENVENCRVRLILTKEADLSHLIG